MIIFERSADGFTRHGDIDFTVGLFQWQRHDGALDGGWAIEPVSDLLARMQRGGPYKYQSYRILPAESRSLDIKPTCAGCGAIA